jgi:hypothetical protein
MTMLLENLYFMSLMTVVISGAMRSYGLSAAGVPYAHVIGLAFMFQVALAVCALWAFGFAVAESLKGVDP